MTSPVCPSASSERYGARSARHRSGVAVGLSASQVHPTQASPIVGLTALSVPRREGRRKAAGWIAALRRLVSNGQPMMRV